MYVSFILRKICASVYMGGDRLKKPVVRGMGKNSASYHKRMNAIALNFVAGAMGSLPIASVHREISPCPFV